MDRNCNNAEERSECKLLGEESFVRQLSNKYSVDAGFFKIGNILLRHGESFENIQLIETNVFIKLC